MENREFKKREGKKCIFCLFLFLGKADYRPRDLWDWWPKCKHSLLPHGTASYHQPCQQHEVTTQSNPWHTVTQQGAVHELQSINNKSLSLQPPPPCLKVPRKQWQTAQPRRSIINYHIRVFILTAPYFPSCCLLLILEGQRSLCSSAFHQKQPLKALYPSM